MDVRPVDLGVAARAGGADDVALGDRAAGGDGDRAEVRERHGEPVGSRDRDGAARARHGAGERHRPGRGRAHRLAGGRADVDAAVLAGGVRVRGIEGERLDDAAARGPRPRSRDGREQERSSRRDEEKTTHRHHLAV
ncbi:MAG TPA: hypothetical protein VFK17_05525 [Gaiellaceae bacterium]|jgi:hypothetical protein|nr:hypothetical protein [Gaiellaceae bacterium]